MGLEWSDMLRMLRSLDENFPSDALGPKEMSPFFLPPLLPSSNVLSFSTSYRRFSACHRTSDGADPPPPSSVSFLIVFLWSIFSSNFMVYFFQASLWSIFLCSCCVIVLVWSIFVQLIFSSPKNLLSCVWTPKIFLHFVVWCWVCFLLLISLVFVVLSCDWTPKFAIFLLDFCYSWREGFVGANHLFRCEG